MKTRDLDAALNAFRAKGGTLRTRDLIALGVHTDSLYALREQGQIVELGRGLYRLANVREAEHPDLAIVAARAPNVAVCLISALSYHGITTQIPSSVHLAVPQGSYHRVKLSIPTTLYRFDRKTFEQGLETQPIGGLPLNIYSAARTVVDCFKFRNKLGLDVALEALRLARQRKRVQNRELLHYARMLRVEKPMTPYLQAIDDREGSEKHRRLSASETPKHVEVEWHAVSTGPSAICHGALPVPHLEVQACAKCRSQRRASSEDNRHPKCAPHHGHRHASHREGRSGHPAGARQGLRDASVAADGLHFIADSAMAEEITKDSEYKGTRILMDARMDNVRLLERRELSADVEGRDRLGLNNH